MYLNGVVIPQVDQHKHLGVVFNERLSWSNHTDVIIAKAAKLIELIRRHRARLPSLAIRSVYISYIRPILEYACIAWCGVSCTDSARLERLQRRAARLITGNAPRSDIDHEILLARAGLQTLTERRVAEQIVFAFRFCHDLVPAHLSNALAHWRTPKSSRVSSLRNRHKVRLPAVKKSVFLKSPLYCSISHLNNLSISPDTSLSVSSLRRLISQQSPSFQDAEQ